MTKKIKKEIILGKMQIGNNFGFFIPNNRDYYGGDFYVNKKNFNGAVDGDLVKAIEIKTKGKKPEVKIISIKNGSNKENEIFEKGIFSYKEGENHGFVDIIGKEKGIFIHKKNMGNAKYGDYVKIKITKHKGKQEGIIVKTLKDDFKILEGIYEDKNTFGFVKTNEKKDIFISYIWNFQAENKQKVKVKIIKEIKGKKPEGIIIEKY